MAKKKGEKTDAILLSAKEVFAGVGYHGATMSNIAKNAGIGDGTLYLYFENKEDILITLFETTIYDEHILNLEEKLSTYNDATFRLLQLVSEHFKYFGQDRILSRVIQIELRQTTPVVSNAIKTVLLKQFEIIEDIVALGQEQGVFRRDISKRDARKLIFGTMDEVVTCWVLSSKEYPLIKMIEPTYKLFLQSLINIPNSMLFSIMKSEADK